MNFTSSQTTGTRLRKSRTYSGAFAMPCGISAKCWMPEVNNTAVASSNAADVRRSTMLLRRSSTTGVKSIGSNTLRVNGSIASCVGDSSALRCSKVLNSRPRTDSMVMRFG